MGVAEHEESTLEEWLEANPGGILEEGGLLVVGRQVVTNLGGYIDLLGVDREGNAVVVELKRDRTPRDIIAQALEYASYVETLDFEDLEGLLRSHENNESLALAKRHRDCFGLDSAETVAFNKDQRVVVVGQHIAPGIKQTASFLARKGLGVTCLEFTFFQDDDGNRLLSREVVAASTPQKPKPTTRAPVDEGEFFASLDTSGRAVLSRVLAWGRERGLSLRWSPGGFSLGVDVGGIRLVACEGRSPKSTYKQTLWTTLRDRHGLGRTAAPERVINALQAQGNAAGLLEHGKYLRCQLTRPFTEQEIDAFVECCESTERALREYGSPTDSSS
ncbi:MAG: endonuclease NucS [Gammaproteobacteria bacterium]|nr:endonuclease NucS [Gammaproteobacteria bacterium]